LAAEVTKGRDEAERVLRQAAEEVSRARKIPIN